MQGTGLSSGEGKLGKCPCLSRKQSWGKKTKQTKKIPKPKTNHHKTKTPNDPKVAAELPRARWAGRQKAGGLRLSPRELPLGRAAVGRAGAGVPTASARVLARLAAPRRLTAGLVLFFSRRLAEDGGAEEAGAAFAGRTRYSR